MPTLIDLSEIMSLTGLGRTATYALTRRPDFPSPYVLSSKTYRWEIEEVKTWLDTCRGRSETRKKVFAKKVKQTPKRKMKINGVNFHRNIERELS